MKRYSTYKQEKVMSKCKYVRESKIEQYTPMCCIEYDRDLDALIAYNSVHPDDVSKYCPFCGGKIKIKEGVAYEDYANE